MKKIFTLLLVFSGFLSTAQEKAFLLEAQIVDELMQPVTDVYVVNLNSHEKDISRNNGSFSIWVTPSDSLIFSHISYYRKVVKVYSLLLNPVVMLEAEEVNIPEIRISSEKPTDMERAEKNLEFLETFSPTIRERLKAEENTPVHTIMVANNNIMRTEAASIHIASFSPSETLGILFSKLKHKDPLTDYSSTRKVVQPTLTEEKEEKKE